MRTAHSKHYANNIQQCGNSHARSRKPCRLPSQQLAHDEQLILSMLMGLHLCAFFHDASLIRCFASQKPGLWILNDFNCLVFFSCSVFLCFFFPFLVFLCFVCCKSSLSNIVHKSGHSGYDGWRGTRYYHWISEFSYKRRLCSS